jgi:hypothetical protein
MAWLRPGFIALGLLALSTLAPRAGTGGQPPQGCAADCSGDGVVRIAELLTAVRIVLGDAEIDSCRAADVNGDGRVAIDELIQGVNAALVGCAAPQPTPTPFGPPTATPDSQMPPSDGAALLSWLQAGHYRAWRGEGFRHPSNGPHFGNVQTFVNDALYDSLIRIPPGEHVRGSAAVKEMYGSDGEEVRGWSVSLKVDDDSSGGDGWYWYERFGSAVFADGRGVSICTQCHGASAASPRDFYLSDFPVLGCAEADRPHDVCGHLQTPGLACAYDGHVRYTSGEPQPVTAYLRPGPYLWINQDTYYARGESGPFSSEGVFDHRFCFSDFPREVDGALALSEDLATLSFTHFSTDGEVALSFSGQRRD